MPGRAGAEPATDDLRPMTSIQVEQTRAFVESATVRIRAKAVDKFVKRGRRYVRHEATVTDTATGTLYFTEIRDILSR